MISALINDNNNSHFGRMIIITDSFLMKYDPTHEEKYFYYSATRIHRTPFVLLKNNNNYFFD